MAPSGTEPNEKVVSVYQTLGDLLEEGDDAFIEEGPEVVQSAIEDPAFFDGVSTEHATDSYTRAKVIGREGEHVIRYMEWPPEYALMPHEHHGRPCFEVLVEGNLFLANMEATDVEDGRYTLDVTDTDVCWPGDAGIVDPRDGSDIHSVYSPVRTRSLHCYPDDNYYGVGYVPADDADGDLYEREKFQLRED
jgi:hypothetical protein